MSDPDKQHAYIAEMLKGIDRYNPDNLPILENYIVTQMKENFYDLEANLAVLKLFQFNPHLIVKTIIEQILLKALTAMPNTDFVLCKCLIDPSLLEEEPIDKIINLHCLLETCKFEDFWSELSTHKDLLESLYAKGFEDSIRKFICHVISITYQRIEKNSLRNLLGGLADNQLAFWMKENQWKDVEDGFVLIGNQEENIKTKNITEKIELENVATVIASYR